MDPQNSTSPTMINDANVAEFLLDHATQQLLHPFWGQEASLAHAAEALEINLNTLLYRVQKLQRWGILRVTREQTRAGRPIKLYSATATRYFIPFGATRSETLEKYLTEAKGYFETLLTHSIASVLRRGEQEWGILVYRDESGQMRTQLALYPDQILGVEQFEQLKPAVLDFYYPGLRLDRDDAKALQRELGALIKKYAQKQGHQAYLIHIGLTPVARS